VTFNQPVDTAAGNFDFNDLTLTNPNNTVIPLTAATTVTDANPGTDTIWTVTIPAQAPAGVNTHAVLGAYSLIVGPSINNAVGFGMDQNGNANLGQAGVAPTGDAFKSTSDLTVGGLKVVAAAANTLDSTAGMTFMTVTFNEPVNGSSLPGNIALTDPRGVGIGVVISGSGTVWQISFAPQFRTGNYQLTVGAGVVDTAGVAMDQNGNGTPGQPGVPPAGDGFSKTFTLTIPPLSFPEAKPFLSILPHDVKRVRAGLWSQTVVVYNKGTRDVKGPISLVPNFLSGGVHLVQPQFLITYKFVIRNHRRVRVVAKRIPLRHLTINNNLLGALSGLPVTLMYRSVKKPVLTYSLLGV
jgi:hypothetical protein